MEAAVTTLWDTTGTEIVKALAAERRAAGAVAAGLVLTLVCIADESEVEAAEAAATVAASQHPCRLLLVVRRNVTAPESRLDAEVGVGGRLGPGEAVVMRMNGRLSLHAESVVLPLLAPDAPVVTWWFGEAPDLIAYDPLGVLAGRRVTDVHNCPDPLAALRGRASDYEPGDTDLAWSRVTPWRSVIAGAFDSVEGPVTKAEVSGAATSASTALLAAWIGSRLGCTVEIVDSGGPGVTSAHLEIGGGEAGGGTSITLVRQGDQAGVLTRTGHPDRVMPLRREERGDLLAEELRRLDDDPVYAASLGHFAEIPNLALRPRGRTHIWRDPAERAAAQ
jgi:glucose-6-phosphate dehydrogenase assembly protein OpcA